MNEQANKVLAELLQKAVSGIDAAVAFSQAQIPDVIHQLLVWNFIHSLIIFLLTAASIPAVVVLVKKQLRRQPDGVIEEGYSWDVGKPKYVPTLIWSKSGELSPILIFFTSFLLLWASWVVQVVSNPSWLKIWIAPKLYLLEYAAHLIN